MLNVAHEFQNTRLSVSLRLVLREGDLDKRQLLLDFKASPICFREPLRLLQGRAHSRLVGRRLDGENRALKSRPHYTDVVLRSFHEQPSLTFTDPRRSGNMRIIPPQLSLAPQLGGKLRLLSSQAGRVNFAAQPRAVAEAAPCQEMP